VKHDRLDPVADVELGQYPLDVGLTVASLSTSSSAISPFESPARRASAPLPRAGAATRARAAARSAEQRACELLDQALGDRRRDESVTPRLPPDGGDKVLGQDVLEQEPLVPARSAS